MVSFPLFLFPKDLIASSRPLAGRELLVVSNIDSISLLGSGEDCNRGGSFLGLVVTEEDQGPNLKPKSQLREAQYRCTSAC